jgi:hypothetical protein
VRFGEKEKDMRPIPALLVSAVILTACGDAGAPFPGSTNTTAKPLTTSESETEPTTQPVAGGSVGTTTAPANTTTTLSGTKPTDPTTTTPPTGVEAALQPFVALAVADLSARLGVVEGEIALVSAVFVVWPDGSLGCPQPGMAYTQVQVEGYQIVLAVGQTQYDYHGGDGQDPFLCTSPLSP